MTAAAAHLTAALPVLATGDARTLLEAVVPGVRGPARYLEELAGHMAAHPAALTSGDTRCPLMLLRLIHVLHDAGYPVVCPGCAHCGKIRADLGQWRPEGRVCGTCDKRSRKGTCARCGAAGATITAKRPEGGICNSCYRADPLVVKQCSECGRVRYPAARLRGGGSLCAGCWKRPVHTCVSCGKTAAAALIDDAGAYCYLCYSRQRAAAPALRALRAARADRAQRQRRRARPVQQLLPGTADDLLTMRADTPLPAGAHRRADLPHLLPPGRAATRDLHPLPA